MLDSSANLGAAQLAEVCSNLEAALPKSSSEGCTELLGQLMDMYRSVVNELDEMYPAFRLREKSAQPPFPVPAG
jgi:HPt (histidine-containing phosphotransfer) domain-containing protein